MRSIYKIYELIGILAASLVVVVLLRVVLNVRFITAITAGLMVATICLAVAVRGHSGAEHWDNPALRRVNHAFAIITLVSYIVLNVLLLTCLIRESRWKRGKPIGSVGI